MENKGLVAVVTGAAAGTGRAIALALATAQLTAPGRRFELACRWPIDDRHVPLRPAQHGGWIGQPSPLLWLAS
jgi:NAD(P)-dependent dehydrogenase (short-subunit alcohol dehydrogenase family)